MGREISGHKFFFCWILYMSLAVKLCESSFGRFSLSEPLISQQFCLKGGNKEIKWNRAKNILFFISRLEEKELNIKRTRRNGREKYFSYDP
jgi:hypothetical protein